MPPQGPSPALFFDTISAYHRTEALRAAIELDLFSQVAAGHQTPTALASACQAAPRGVRILADYLTIIGFLHKHGDRYELTADAAVFLDRKSPAYCRRRGQLHACSRHEGELSKTDGGRAARRHGGFRRGNGLPRQPDLGRVRPRDGSA